MKYKLNQDAYARVFQYLMEGPGSCYEMQEVSGLALVTLQNLMKCFQKYKIVHRSAWDVNSRGIDTTPIYSFGPGRNKKRRSQTTAQRTQKYRDKLKAIKQANILNIG